MKSKKTILFFAIVALSMISVPSFSQLKLGLKGEVGINKPSFSGKMFKVENMNAFKVGPTIEFMFPAVGFGIDGSILYSNEKMTVKDFKGDKSLFEVANHYLDVPINLKYKIGIISPLKVYLAAGPYVQFRVGGEEFDWEELLEQFEDKTFQAGVNLGFGAEIIERVQLGFNYRLKLTDDYSVNDRLWNIY